MKMRSERSHMTCSWVMDNRRSFEDSRDAIFFVQRMEDVLAMSGRTAFRGCR